MQLPLTTKKGHYLPLFQKVGMFLLVVVLPFRFPSNQAKNATITPEGAQTLCELSYSVVRTQKPSAALELALTPEVAQ